MDPRQPSTWAVPLRGERMHAPSVSARPGYTNANSPRWASGAGDAAGGPVHRADHSAQRGPHDRLADPDAPVDPVADLDLEVSRRLGVAAGGERVLGIVEHPDPDTAKA